MVDHQFQPRVNDFGEVTEWCDRCDRHRSTHTALTGRVVQGGEVLTVAEVALAAGLAESTVRVHRKRGTMPPADGVIGGVPYWQATTVSAWLATRRRRGNPYWGAQKGKAN